LHEDLDAVCLAFPDLDDAVEIRFLVQFSRLDLALDDVIVGGVDVFIQRGGDLTDLERGEEPVVDAVLEGIDKDGLAEVGVGVSAAD